MTDVALAVGRASAGLAPARRQRDVSSRYSVHPLAEATTARGAGAFITGK